MTQGSTAVRARRRGPELEAALYRATLAELAEVGYGALTMEGVAARAQTGKAALYRRWPGKHELVLAALRHALPALPDLDPRRTARENLRRVFTLLCDVFGGRTLLPSISIAVDLLREPTLRASFADEIVAPRLELIRAILRHGANTGELTEIGPLAAQTGPALILQTVLLTGEPPTDAQLEHIIDTVLGRAR